MPRRILVPVDFSPTSLHALRYALLFAQQFGSTLHLVHVYEPPSFMAGYQALPKMVAAPDAEVMQRIKIELDSLVAAQDEPQIPMKSFVRKGKGYDQIIKVAKEESIDLIIITTHGYSGLKHTLMGSTAERVVRHAPCPVLVVREKA